MAIGRKKDTKTMGDILAEQPKVRVMVPSTPGIPEKHDYKRVTVNGYPYQIKCGEWVDVPETVAEILRNSDKAIKKSAEAFAAYTSGLGKEADAKE